MKKINIRMYGYGGEVTAGTLSDQEYMEVLDYDSEHGVQDLEWYEFDDLVHAYGVSPDSATIVVEDVESGEVLYEGELGELNDDPFEVDELYFEPTDENMILCFNSEKGEFFNGDIELSDDEEFDINNIKLHLSDILIEDENQDLSISYEIINMVTYNEEEVDNMGGETNGKSFDVNFFPRYEN